MRSLFMMFVAATVFMIQDASATALPPVNTNDVSPSWVASATALPPVNTNDVSPSWVASGSREVTYANNILRYVSEVNVPDFKTLDLCKEFIADQELLAIELSAKGNAGAQVFSAKFSKQR